MKPIKLGAILTNVEEGGAESAVKWTESAKSVFAFTKETLPPAFGLVGVTPKRPSLREALYYHVNRIRGKEAVALCLPPLVLPKDFTPINNLMVNRLEMSWAFYGSSQESVVPDIIIITTSLIPIMLRDLKDDIPFSGNAWAIWMMDWLKKRMQPHKLFDVTYQLDLPALQPLVIKEPVAPVEPVVKKKKKK